MDQPIRKRNRLKNYDYSSCGGYFVTVCTKNKQKLLGRIVRGSTYDAPQMQLSKYGEIVREEIAAIEKRYSNVTVDQYVIMPNHIHMIIFIREFQNAGRINPSPTKCADIPNIIGKFKAGVTRRVGDAFMHPAKAAFWQRSYHDHIIRDETDYQKIWQYIDTNPVKWELDRYFISGRENDEQNL